MSDKGHVYYCRWEKTAAGSFIGWDKKHSFLQAEAATKQVLVSLLGNAVGEYHNDHEAAIEFEPSLGTGEGHDDLFVDNFVQVIWNTGFRYRESANDAFTGGRCKKCGGGIGKRSEKALIVEASVAGTDGAFSPTSSQPPPCYGEPGWLIIVSEGFLKLLTRLEHSQFEARPIRWARPRPVKFFEVIPKAFIPPVAIKGRDAGGWRCDGCGRICQSLDLPLEYGVQAVCRSDLPSAIPGCFFVGDPTFVRFCVSRKRWQAFCGKPAARGLMSSRLAVVNETQCERHPTLPTLQEVTPSNSARFGV